MSSHHRHRYCGPCFVCGKQQPRYDHYCALTCGEQRFFQQHIGSDIPDDSCLCRAHRTEAKRHRSDPEYVPSWKRDKGSQNVMKCMYPECATTSSTERVIIPSKETQAVFCEALNLQKTLPLCETHYHRLYRQTHINHPCAGCGAKPKSRQGAYTRHSPDATTVSV